MYSKRDRHSSTFTRFFSHFNILAYVQLAAGFTKLMMSVWIDAGIIFAVVVLNALVGFIQEGKAEMALDSIRNMLSPEARTMRSGETRMIPAEQLVPGDVVLLESGDKIPATHYFSTGLSNSFPLKNCHSSAATQANTATTQTSTSVHRC